MPEYLEALRISTNKSNIILTAKAGFYIVTHYRNKRRLFVLALFINALLMYRIFIFPEPMRILSAIFTPLAIMTFLALAFFTVAAFGYVRGAVPLQRDFARVGFMNCAGETPYLIERKNTDDGATSLTFLCKGLPLSTWTDNQSVIETALNMYVSGMLEGADRRTITLECVPPGYTFKKVLWEDIYTHYDNDALLILGKGLTQLVTVNLDKIPHILIGGSTGSGKTILLKTLLRQAILQKDTVYISDFKGGVDFSPQWHKTTHIITREEDLKSLLDSMQDEITKRKALFLEAETPNIASYRTKTGKLLPRIIFSCDEIAELLDKTGADKDRKELLGQIEVRLSFIARQGRAFGVHLILATQRPDANILAGQIKNNMDMRICGKADATLSTIIVGDGRADEKIPKQSQGRFITNDGTLFQGFFLDEK